MSMKNQYSENITIFNKLKHDQLLCLSISWRKAEKYEINL